MKCAILIPCLLTGGTEISTIETAIGLKSLGHQVEIIVYFDETDEKIIRLAKANNIGITQLGVKRKKFPNGVLDLSLKLMKVLKRESYGLIWIQHMTPTLVPLIIARNFTKRLISSVHVSARHYSILGRLKIRAATLLICDILVCVSNNSATGIFGRSLDYLVRNTKVSILPNTLNEEEVQSAHALDWRKKLALPNGAKIIGYVGRLEYIKGIDIFVKNAITLNRKYKNLYWIIIGDGSLFELMKIECASVGQQNNFHFMGRIDHKSVYCAIKGFDVCVVPSREEGFGLTAIETMACGIPLVASSVDALKEIISDGQTGVLFNPTLEYDLALKLNNVFSDKHLLNRLKNQAPSYVLENFGRVEYAHRLQKLLNAKEKVTT